MRSRAHTSNLQLMDDTHGTTYDEVVMNGDEIATLLSTLDRTRRTFAWKCGGLDADGLRATRSTPLAR